MFQGRHRIGRTKVRVILSETPPSEEQKAFTAYTYDENEKKAIWLQQFAAATDHEESTAGFSAPSTGTSRLCDNKTTDWPDAYDYLSLPFNAKEQTLYILVTGLTPSMSTEDIVSYFQSYRCGAGTVTEMVFYNHDKSIASVKICNCRIQNHLKLQGSLIICNHRVCIRCIKPPPPPRDQSLRVYTYAINHTSHSSAELGGRQSAEIRPQGKEPSTFKAANSINYDQPIPGSPPLNDSSMSSTRGPLHQERLPGLEDAPDYTRNDLSPEVGTCQMGNRGTTKQFTNKFLETQALPVVTEQPRSNTSGNQQNRTDSYRSVSEMIRLKKGILTDHMVDVYVNTAHFALDLSQGAVAQSLLKAGGPQLQKECRDYVQQHGRVPEWGHAVTRGGNLQCRHVIHAVAAHATTRDSKQGMSTMITNIMDECERLGATSVAFPAIGTGQLGFKIDTVASIMVQMIASFLQRNNPPSSLKMVLLVLFDDKTLSAFAKQCSKLPTAPQPSSVSGEQNQSKRHSSTGAHEEWTNSQPVHRTALLSNAHEPTPHPVTNATVTPYSQMNDSRKSAFSAPHTTTAPMQGGVHESAMSTSSQQTQAPGGSASLQSFQLGSVNVQIIHGDITNEECDGLISTSTDNLKLMSFGVMGALLRKGGPELQRDCNEAVSKQGMLRSTHVVVTGVGRPGGLKCSKILHILAPGNPRKLKSVVHTALKKANEQKLSVVALPAIGTGVHGFTPEESAKGICEAITEFGMSKPNYSKVLKLVLFEEGHYNQFANGFNAAATVVSQSQSKGWFQRFRIFGSGKSSSQSSNNTATIGSSQLQAAGVTYNHIFQWQWKSSKSGAFVSISPVGNEKIEAAYLSGQTPFCNIPMIPDEPPFTLYFGNMIAVPSKAPFQSVEIQRVPLKVVNEQDSTQSARGPGTSISNSRPEVTNVHLESQEYQDVCNRFQRSMPSQRYDVKCIQRINNPSLWTRYSSRKAAMNQGHPTGGREEKWLFHRCSPEKVQEVQQHGFNRTYSLREDLGKGMYFTEDSQSSLTYGQNHLKYMFLARVLTGHCAMATPPPKYGRHPQDVYDSVVDDVVNPKVFVVFSEDQAYPEYLIIYATHY